MRCYLRVVAPELRDVALSFGTALPLMIVGIVVVVGALTCMSPTAVALISVGLALISAACARAANRLRVEPYQAHIALLHAENVRLAALLQLGGSGGDDHEGGLGPASGGLYS
jgi:hypothetical protein